MTATSTSTEVVASDTCTNKQLREQKLQSSVSVACISFSVIFFMNERAAASKVVFDKLIKYIGTCGYALGHNPTTAVHT